VLFTLLIAMPQVGEKIHDNSSIWLEHIVSLLIFGVPYNGWSLFLSQRT
jgi:hypothetical protein